MIRTEWKERALGVVFISVCLQRISAQNIWFVPRDRTNTFKGDMSMYNGLFAFDIIGRSRRCM